MTFKFHSPSSVPNGQWIWVFASDEGGSHAKGAARVARVNFRAAYGASKGMTGSAYAIPTTDKHKCALPLASVQSSITEFLQFAAANPGKDFFVTSVGTELPGVTDDVMGPLFAAAPENCSLPEKWRTYVSQARAAARSNATDVPPTSAPDRNVERCPFCGHFTYSDLIMAPDLHCTHVVLHPK